MWFICRVKSLCTALLNVRDMCCRLGNVELCNFEKNSTYTLSKFRDAQMQKLTEVVYSRLFIIFIIILLNSTQLVHLKAVAERLKKYNAVQRTNNSKNTIKRTQYKNIQQSNVRKYLASDDHYSHWHPDTLTLKECPDVKNYKWQLNPVWHKMLYSCTHMATVGVKGLTLMSYRDAFCLGRVLGY